MKKATLILISILLALFAFTACNNSIDYIIDDQPTDPMYMPLTLEFTAAGEFSVKYYDYGDLNPVKFSINGGEHVPFPDGGASILVHAGDIVCFYRDVDGAKGDPAYHVNIACTADCYVYGNVMSLFDSDDFAELYSVLSQESLMGLFFNNTHIKNHDEIDLVLPATELYPRCYKLMFYGCTGLTRAPALPATTLANRCYENMFFGCTGLTVAPELPANTLADICYYGMFKDCSSLTLAPALTAANVMKSYCYACMFEKCTNITAPAALPTVITPAVNWDINMYKDSGYTPPNLVN